MKNCSMNNARPLRTCACTGSPVPAEELGWAINLSPDVLHPELGVAANINSWIAPVLFAVRAHSSGRQML